MQPRRLGILIVVIVLLSACGADPQEVAARQISSTTQTTTTTTTTTTTSVTAEETTTTSDTPSLTTALTATASNLVLDNGAKDDREMVASLLAGFTSAESFVRGHLSFVREDGTISCRSWDNKEFQGANPNQPPVIWCYSAQRFYLMPAAMKQARQQSEVLAAGYALMAAAHYALGDNHVQPVESNMPKVAELAGYIAHNLVCDYRLDAQQVEQMSPVFGVETQRFLQTYNVPCA